MQHFLAESCDSECGPMEQEQRVCEAEKRNARHHLRRTLVRYAMVAPLILVGVILSVLAIRNAAQHGPSVIPQTPTIRQDHGPAERISPDPRPLGPKEYPKVPRRENL